MKTGNYTPEMKVFESEISTWSYDKLQKTLRGFGVLKEQILRPIYNRDKDSLTGDLMDELAWKRCLLMGQMATRFPAESAEHLTVTRVGDKPGDIERASKQIRAHFAPFLN